MQGQCKNCGLSMILTATIRQTCLSGLFIPIPVPYLLFRRTLHRWITEETHCFEEHTKSCFLVTTDDI